MTDNEKGLTRGPWLVAGLTVIALVAATLLLPLRKGPKRGVAPDRWPDAAAAQPSLAREAAGSPTGARRFSGLLARPDGVWLASVLAASALLAAAVFVPLWKMELVAPQYPKGLTMYAYGYKFADDPATNYDDIREINGLNHYIGMKAIKEVREMDLFVPGIATTIAGGFALSFVAWKRRWLRALTIAGFWFVPLFFVADLQYWLYDFGHTMDPEAALDTPPFTPRVVGDTHVWNFHSESSLELGFYLMAAAALVVTVLPPAAGWLRALRARLRARRRHGLAAGPLARAGGRPA